MEVADDAWSGHLGSLYRGIENIRVIHITQLLQVKLWFPSIGPSEQFTEGLCYHSIYELRGHDFWYYELNYVFPKGRSRRALQGEQWLLTVQKGVIWYNYNNTTVKTVTVSFSRFLFGLPLEVLRLSTTAWTYSSKHFHSCQWNKRAWVRRWISLRL